MHYRVTTTEISSPTSNEPSYLPTEESIEPEQSVDTTTPIIMTTEATTTTETIEKTQTSPETALAQRVEKTRSRARLGHGKRIDATKSIQNSADVTTTSRGSSRRRLSPSKDTTKTIKNSRGSSRRRLSSSIDSTTSTTTPTSVRINSRKRLSSRGRKNQETTTTVTERPTTTVVPVTPSSLFAPPLSNDVLSTLHQTSHKPMLPIPDYGKSEVKFNRLGDVEITEIGTIEDTNPDEVNLILSGLGGQRRGLSRPSTTTTTQKPIITTSDFRPKSETISPSVIPTENPTQVSTGSTSQKSILPDYEYVYDYDYDTIPTSSPSPSNPEYEYEYVYEYVYEDGSPVPL